ncbi:hypothetical protein VV99796_03187 [Vibrio vulnificus]|uniref:hypothetical protein n=1 Tax=Vibrio vulnificus TaxID=672 RepID=UPI00092B0B23|nr:hypothetical protein [Vibrio vulnificus]EHT4943625.1 hypothetical protein [Vibrio vulnificus]OJI24116.1 hypothetical protein VV99796_03187 [Vibrio vulnificus]OJI46714.1 hypothetical protein VVS316_03032 [Vibrio vulnificus]POB07472.1 hypothetical protein CRN33_08370 [Vibrio vulnificus]
MVTKIKNFGEVVDKYDVLLDKFQSLIDSSGRKTNIYNTKLGEYKERLSNFEELSDMDLANLVGTVNSYNFIGEVFESNNIQYKDSEILKVIEGQSDDSQHKSNDILFELSMAARFALSTNQKAKINLDTDCDVIVNDSAAIECKCIHNAKRISDNVRKAINQINKRIEDGQAKYGLVALDLSHVAVTDQEKKFVYDLFDKFCANHSQISNLGDSVPISVLKNEHFKTMVRAFLSHCSEAKLYQYLSESLVKEKMNNNVKAIVYQVSVYFIFSFDNIFVPVPVRIMNYFINPKLTNDEADDIRGKIHSLEVGH